MDKITLSQGNDFFDKEKIKFLQKHEEGIQQYATDVDYQKSYLQKFSISKSS